MAGRSSFLKRWRWVFLTLGIIWIGVILLFVPWGVSNLRSNPQPAQSYEAAVQRIQTLEAKDATVMNPVCKVQFLSQGQKAERAIILVHGYTSCPQQFLALGQQFYDLGYNVLIAPMPLHGYKDRLTEAHANLKAEDLARYADDVVDIAQGLGEQVTMMGLSVGGVVTAWAAQHRNDLDLAVVISPAFGYGVIPPPTTAFVMNLFRLLPNGYEWWNPAKQAEGGVPHGYPRYAKRALAEALRLGFSVQKSAKKQKPPTPLLVITNANDHQINNERTATIVELWRRKDAQLETYEFPENLKLEHDLIEPLYQPKETAEIIYPKLLEWVLKAHKNSFSKVYRLVAKTEQADINYKAIENINRAEGDFFSRIEQSFHPVTGKFTVYQLKSSYPGFSFRGEGYYIFHDVLTIKTDENNIIQDAYHYTLEWSDLPSDDLYKSTASQITLTDGMNISQLRLTNSYDVEGSDKLLLKEESIIQLK